MSYRLITKAVLTIVSAAGQILTREIEVRAYPAPKRAPVGSLILDGTTVAYQRTGGKGRGTIDRQFAYFPLKFESAYFELTAAESVAFPGATVTITTGSPAQLAAEQPKVARRVRKTTAA